MSTLRVAVVGGGIGGLAAAVALTRRGIRTWVHEQAPALGDVGAGVGLGPNGARVLERLGLGAELARVAAPLTDVRFCSADGTVVATDVFGAGRERPMLGVHRADLIGLLADALPAETVRTDHRCVGLRQDSGGAVLSFANGREVAADVVVAADGIHSLLREHVVEPVEPVYSGSVAYRGVVPADRLPDWPPRTMRNWMGDGRHFLVYPVRGGELVNYVGFVPSDERLRESWSAPGDPAELAAEFAGWDPLIGRILAEVDTTFRWGLYDRAPLPRWSRGRLTLLGDAAHPMLPHMGQGANQSIEDGVALAALLTGADAETAPAALARYESLRRERTARFQRGSRANGALFDTGGAALDESDAEALAFVRDLSWVYDYDVEREALALS